MKQNFYVTMTKLKILGDKNADSVRVYKYISKGIGLSNHKHISFDFESRESHFLLCSVLSVTSLVIIFVLGIIEIFFHWPMIGHLYLNLVLIVQLQPRVKP